MKTIRKYVALEIRKGKEESSSFSHHIIPNLSMGYESEIAGGKVTTTFDSEEAAMEYAYEQDKYGEWLILPKISFDNYP